MRPITPNAPAICHPHVATYQEASLIRGVEVTTANAHDASELGAILPEAPATRMATAPTSTLPEPNDRAMSRR